MSYLPEKNDRFKLKFKSHPDLYAYDAQVFICVRWVQTYRQKDRKKKSSPRFCEARLEGAGIANFSLKRSVWLFEEVNEAPSIAQEPRSR